MRVVPTIHGWSSRPIDKKYLFVYPFVKTRAWYALSLEDRKRMMNEHIRVGLHVSSVSLNTTYSFGLDDQEFVVAFETDNISDFLDLVQELRETEASRYTLRDTPMFTCVEAAAGRDTGSDRSVRWRDACTITARYCQSEA